MTRILAAMSGGVDSSVAAAYLKEKGYEVIGATMNIFPDYENPDKGEGSFFQKEIKAAQTIAERLKMRILVNCNI